ncbi:MAG: Uncharacterised protein [Methanobacteriota archaeon]|nr:MAG: Uncharacterised protein [Euryarchaeota archaeon]
MASDTFLTGGSGQETINWEFAVAENMTEWKKNQDNIEVQIEYEVQADNSAIGCGTVFDCSAEIYFFYTHPDENRDNAGTDCDGCNSNMILPILEIDVPLPGDEDGDGEGGSDSESTPGFTTALMITSMMAAAVVLIPKKKEDLE